MARRAVNTVQVKAVKPAAPTGIRRGVLTVLSGSRPGMILPLGEADLTIGRTEESMVALADESLSRKHARFYEAAGRYFVEDLESTNGTFLNGERLVAAAALEDGARIQLGVETLLRFTLQDETELEVTRRMYEAAVRDPLTGCFNRNFLDERLLAEFSYAKRHGTSLTLLFVDADHFKVVNDTHGHPAGDEVLRRVAALLRESIRSEDILARFGGEEFVIAVRGIPMPGVRVIAERVRAGVEALVIEHEGARIAATVSVGVATQSPAHEHASVDELLATADAALYEAKARGRNRVHFA
jgi:diguanylate cyclase (GGDEF)-like protein